MPRAHALPLLVLLLCASCTRGAATATPQASDGPGLALPAVIGASDPDGEDDGTIAHKPGPQLTRLAVAASARFQRIDPPEGAHPLVCDLTPFRGAMVASFAVKPIDVDGARIYSYRPEAKEPWTLSFDWDRNGVPHKTHEVGGQGITRVRSINGRLLATDSDAPLYGGFGLSPAPFEDYVFVSNEDGSFPALGAGDRPPANTRVAPLAFHMFDVIQYRGTLVASGGTIATGDRSGTRFPGGLFVGDLTSGPLAPRWRPGEGARVGVVRTTYMHRFRGRLYVGLQNNERRAPWDLAVVSGSPRATTTPVPVLARVTKEGGWLTRRFASVDGRLYWVASGYPQDRRGSALFASDDGARFRRVRLPPGAGAPQDLLAIDTTRYLLTDTGLYRAGADDRFSRIADAPKGAFDRFNTFCSAPLSVMGNSLYAGSTRDGAIYRIAVQ